MYIFVDDKFMLFDDFKGRFGLILDEYLKKGCGKLCLYERNCIYGNRCKYFYFERNLKKVEVDFVLFFFENFFFEVFYGKVLGLSRLLFLCFLGVR